MFSQLGVTTGRKKKPSSLAMIEAQAAMLPQQQTQREEKTMAGKVFGLQQEELGLRKTELARGKKMGEEAAFRADRAFKHQKEQEKKARNIELANMGLTVLGQTGWGEQVGKAGSAIGKKVWGGAKDIVSGIAGKVSGLFGLF